MFINRQRITAHRLLCALFLGLFIFGCQSKNSVETETPTPVPDARDTRFEQYHDLLELDDYGEIVTDLETRRGIEERLVELFKEMTLDRPRNFLTISDTSPLQSWPEGWGDNILIELVEIGQIRHTGDSTDPYFVEISVHSIDRVNGSTESRWYKGKAMLWHELVDLSARLYWLYDSAKLSPVTEEEARSIADKN